MPSGDRDRPNILFVLTDDQGYWALGCAGNEEIRTPRLDQIATGGIGFENFFCASPVCSPARASILTGRIPSQHGVHDWIRVGNSTVETEHGGRLIQYLKGQTAFTEILVEQGYTCGLSGKWHLGDSHHPQKGFSFWYVHAQGGSPYRNAPMVRGGAAYREPRYVTDAITDEALAFLDGQEGSSAPFYLSVHYTAPHSPWTREDHPEELYDDYFENCPFESMPKLPMHPWQVDSAPVGDSEENRRAILSGYFAAVTAMDTNVGRLLDRIEAMGVSENTLIVFTSDNGMNMGHHGIYGKGNGTVPQNMYDTSVKVPMLIWRPGSVPEGTVCDALLSHYDIMPTLLDYLDMENPESHRLPGRSFADLLRGKTFDEREHVVVFDEYGPVRMIRAKDRKYVHRYPYGPHELYDLAGDPDETENLVDLAEHHEEVCDMKRRLDEWFVRYADPAVDGVREAVYGAGQLGLVGPAGKGRKSFSDEYRRLCDRPPPV